MLPLNIDHRLDLLRGSTLTLVYDPAGRTRATLLFHSPGRPPITVAVDSILEVSWPFARYPSLRVSFRFASAVRNVRVTSVRSFTGSTRHRVVRVDLEFEGSPALALEGDGLFVGPVLPQLASPPATPRSSPSMVS